MASRRGGGGGGRKRGGGGGGRARGRASSGGSGGGASGLAEAFDALLSPVASLTKGMEGAVESVVKFGKNTLEGAAEVKRAEAAYENLKSTLTMPALQGLAGLASPGAANFVGGIRQGLGKVAAAGAAAGELEDVSAEAAFRGMPLDKDLQKSIFPLIQARREAVEQARQQAADVSGAELGKQVSDKGKGFLEFIGIGDILRGFMEGGNRTGH